MEVLAHDVDRGRRARLPGQRPAQTVHVTVVELLVVVKVGRVAVALQVVAGRTHRQRLADRHVDHALHADRVVVAVFRFTGSAETVEVWLGGAEVDHARGRVAAEQGALRTAQHFDLRQIEELAFEQAGEELRRVVHVDRGRAVAGHAGAKVTDAADGEAGGGEVRLGEGDVGQRKLQVERVADLLLGQVLGREGADRDRHRLQALRLALSGHDDFLDTRAAVGGLRALRERRRCNGCCAHTCEQGKFAPHISILSLQRAPIIFEGRPSGYRTEQAHPVVNRSIKFCPFRSGILHRGVSPQTPLPAITS